MQQNFKIWAGLLPEVKLWLLQYRWLEYMGFKASARPTQTVSADSGKELRASAIDSQGADQRVTVREG